MAEGGLGVPNVLTAHGTPARSSIEVSGDGSGGRYVRPTHSQLDRRLELEAVTVGDEAADGLAWLV
jgi:hypothetical protein